MQTVAPPFFHRREGRGKCPRRAARDVHGVRDFEEVAFGVVRNVHLVPYHAAARVYSEGTLEQCVVEMKWLGAISTGDTPAPPDSSMFDIFARSSAFSTLDFRVAELVRVPIDATNCFAFRSLTTSATPIFRCDEALEIDGVKSGCFSEALLGDRRFEIVCVAFHSTIWRLGRGTIHRRRASCLSGPRSTE